MIKLIKTISIGGILMVFFVMAPYLSRAIEHQINTGIEDNDYDGILDATDNCPTFANPFQENLDKETKHPNTGQVLMSDAEGDACDWDDFVQGQNEAGVDCGGFSPYDCTVCTWCDDNKLTPLRVTGGSDKIDVAFIPASDLVTSAQAPRFHEIVMATVRFIYFHEFERAVNDSSFSNTGQKVNMLLPVDWKQKFNFYLYNGDGLAEMRPGFNRLPADYEKAKAWMDVSHAIADNVYSGTQQVGGFADLGTPGRIWTEESLSPGVLHELSHLMLNLGHTGDNANGITGWATLADCRAFTHSMGWPDLCNIRPDTGFAKYDCYLDKNPICLLGVSNFFDPNGVDIGTLPNAKSAYGPAEVKRVNEILRNWEQYDAVDPITGYDLVVIRKRDPPPQGQFKKILIVIRVSEHTLDFVKTKKVRSLRKLKPCVDNQPCLKVDILSKTGKILKTFQLKDPRRTLGSGKKQRQKKAYIYFQAPETATSVIIQDTETINKKITIDI